MTESSIAMTQNRFMFLMELHYLQQDWFIKKKAEFASQETMNRLHGLWVEAGIRARVALNYTGPDLPFPGEKK